MKKVFILSLCLLLSLVPLLFGADNTVSDSEVIQYDSDAKINLNPKPVLPQIDDGRALGDLLMTIDLAAIGVPVSGYAGAGITWDGTHLYYENQNDHTMYVIDPTGPSLVTSWSTGIAHPWGVGSETNMWVTDAVGSPGMTYEYLWDGTPTGNSFSCGSWMADISEWWAAGEIWLLAVGGSNKIYKFSLPGGILLDSLSDPTWTGISQRALTYDPYNNTFWLGGWNVGTVWEVDANTGAVLRQFNPADPNIAGLAYDWQSTLHPSPVLWLTTNNATDYIYMIDADNPQPAPDTIRWDFEDGWQDWISSGACGFPACWGVYDAAWQSGSGYQCPSSGDSSMFIDSDNFGAACEDTALSPMIIPNVTTTNWFWYGFLYNDCATADYFEVGIKYYDGATWTVIPLKTYTSNYFGDWDSVDVSAYNTYNLIQVYFYYYAEGWDWYAAFDNVTINGEIYVPGIEERPVQDDKPLNFGFATDMPTLTKAYTAIKYTTTENSIVNLKVYDATGRAVRTLVNRPNERAGTKTVYWNGKDNSRRTVAAGVYFVRLSAQGRTATNKLVIVR